MKTDQIATFTRSTVVDLDADPFVHYGWKVLPIDQPPNVINGQFAFNPSKLSLYLSEKQKGNGWIVGNQLLEELKTHPVFNANLLDWLLKPENQHLIPEEWKRNAVFFWGTIYRNPDGRRCVRSLDWLGGAWGLWWCSGCRWLAHGWRSGSPAAVSAS
ncbi:MAG: hypothetical protein AAB554_04060 [Patescibacteria group bacterium]